MCGRFTLTMPAADMATLFDTTQPEDFPPRFNIAPTQPVLAIWEEQARRATHLARWGLVPAWVKDPREFPLLINARADTLAEKPAFRDSLRNKRCIVPASGYYEWHTASDGTKQPYYITLAEAQPMAFAGLYSIWAGPNGEEVDTVAIVTTDANADIDFIHHRMPAVLLGDDIDLWLNTREVDARAAMTLLKPLPTGAVRWHPVDKRVGAARFDDARLVQPVDLGSMAPEPKPDPKPKGKKDGGQLDLF